LRKSLKSMIQTSVDSNFGSANKVNQAMEELEQVGSRLPSIIQTLSSCIGIIIFLSMVSFCLWGIYKIHHPEDYMEVESKIVQSTATVSTELPNIAFQQIGKGNLSLRLRHCTIERGDSGTKACVDLHTSKCEMDLNEHNRLTAECMPPSVRVSGTFGDEVYRYVSVDVHLLGESSESATLGLLWKHRNSISSTMVMAQKYNMTAHQPEAREIFFGRVVATEGTPLGLTRHESLQESEELLRKSEYMVKLNEYSYPLPLKKVTGQEVSLGMLLYLRDARVERQDFYEVYSVFRLLEESGGLFTSLEFVSFLPLLIFARVYPRVRRFVVGRGYA